MTEAKAVVERTTLETTVSAEVSIYGNGAADVNTGIRFLDHLLRTLACYSLMDLRITARATEPSSRSLDEAHHVSEDVGICLGQAISGAMSKALNFPGNNWRIRRFGHALVPMDDALVFAAVDAGGRPFFAQELGLEGAREGEFQMDWAIEFLRCFALNARINLHLGKLRGTDPHHTMEGAFKATALALRDALEEDPRRREVPSTKGMV